jgi:23S rRNA G2445 N2-methylase RlmL
MDATVIARSVRGLEWIGADEIAQRLPAATGIRLAAREITFTLPWHVPGLLDLRTVDDAFLRVGTLSGVGTTVDVPPAVARRLAGLDWRLPRDQVAQLRDLPAQPRFDVVASLDGGRRFNRYALENAVGPAIASRLDARFEARTEHGRAAATVDLTVRLFVRGESLTAALRLDQRPLHRRWYKQDTGPGTLHPPLAAALTRLAPPGPGGVVADPFCGDGTVAIEAALEHPHARVLASDIDPGRLSNARANAGRAGADPRLIRADAGRLPWRPGSVDVVVTNPPWSVAVSAGGVLARSLRPFWSALRGQAPLVCLLVDAEHDAARTLPRLGYQVALAQQVRIAGRMSHVVLCAPQERPEPALPAGLVGWYRRAQAAGVITEGGF